jgi:hypothetical protein
VRGRRTFIVTLAALGTLLAAPAVSQAAVTIGSNLATPADGTNRVCGASPMTGCTAAYMSEAALDPARKAPGGLRSPLTGVVTRLRLVSANNAAAPMAFRIITPTNAATATGGPSLTHTPTAGLNVLQTRLPIRISDVIGVDCCATAGAAHQFWVAAMPGGVSVFGGFGGGPIPNGGSSNSDSSFLGTEMLVNADVEADADGDGFGDESQDLCPTDAATQSTCPPVAKKRSTCNPKKKKKRKKGKAAETAKKKKKKKRGCKRKKGKRKR